MYTYILKENYRACLRFKLDNRFANRAESEVSRANVRALVAEVGRSRRSDVRWRHRSTVRSPAEQ